MQQPTMSLTTLQTIKSSQSQVSGRTSKQVCTYMGLFVKALQIGKRTTMMSTRNFYNAMTPGSSLTSDMMIGKSAYKQIQDSEINSRSTPITRLSGQRSQNKVSLNHLQSTGTAVCHDLHHKLQKAAKRHCIGGLFYL